MTECNVNVTTWRKWRWKWHDVGGGWLFSYLPQASSCGCRLRKENCVNKTQRETPITNKESLWGLKNKKPCNGDCAVIAFRRREKKTLLVWLVDLLWNTLYRKKTSFYLFCNPKKKKKKSAEGTENCVAWQRMTQAHSYRLALWIIMKTSVITFSFK